MLDDEQYKNLFITALFTGMRQSELLGLSWAQMDFKASTIAVTQQLQEKNGAYFISTPKSNKGRIVTPAPFVLEALADEQRRQTAARLRAGSAWENSLGLVFTDALGKNLVHRTVVKHFKKLAEQIGTPAARFHDLRHTYAVTALQAGDDIKTVQGNLGHAMASFTLDVYGHVTEQMKHESAARMGNFTKALQNA